MHAHICIYTHISVYSALQAVARCAIILHTPVGYADACSLADTLHLSLYIHACIYAYINIAHKHQIYITFVGVHACNTYIHTYTSIKHTQRLRDAGS